MSAPVETPKAESRSMREWLLAAGAGVLMVLCCVGAPILAGTIGAVALGTVVGGAAIVLAALAVCLLAFRLFRASRARC